MSNANAFFEFLEYEKRRPRAAVHSMHRYFGKLVPAIPRAAIQAFTQPGQVVGDPFGGSGTTAVESRMTGRAGWARDLNPLSVSIARAKTDDLDGQVLSSQLAELEKQLAAVKVGGEIPFCPNMEHWFRPEVVAELALIKSLLASITAPAVQNFFRVCLSAIIREVSNADPRHVFPGYSKRMRQLDCEGRLIDVRAAFLRGCQRRIRGYGRYRAQWPAVMDMDLQVGDSCREPLPSCDLMVTNPPYLGSIRYLETMKLEMFWLSWLADSGQYQSLDRQVMASERWYKREYDQPLVTGLVELDRITDHLFTAGHRKMSYVTAKYFLMVDEFLRSAAAGLRFDGHLVVKISDSYIRSLTVPAHQLWIQMAAKWGLDVIECRTDEYRSRSLLTKRNTFSRMLPHDYLMVFQRV